MNQFRPGILQGIFPRSRLLERRRLEITVVALVVSRCAPPLAFACPMPARCASFVAYNGESKYPSLASQPRSGNAGPKLDANVPQLLPPGRPLERDSCLHNERDNMRPFRLATLMAGVVVSVFMSSLAGQRVLADSVVPVTSEAANISSGICYPETSSSASDRSCSTRERADETARARAYLIATASPGYTMTRQGPERAIGLLHPAFINRLAATIAEARAAGLPFAGIFSAYRPPAFGVGGFLDKFHSLHTYGLAVDITGIGAPGTPSALLWHEIAARHGVICPYGPHNPVEWNHCQPTRVKIIVSDNPLRETVTADGPIDLESMFEVGYSVITASSSTGGAAAAPPAHFFKPRRARTQRSVEPRVPAASIIQDQSVASWAVLLVGDRSQINALAAYRRLSKKHEAIFRGHQPVVVHTSTRSANWHRVRIEASSREVAEALCSKLRAVGGSCLLQRI